jgi:alkanesulfonate monooxygenase SsuD/methylene tetrahydromethanopterin reductase-like flavin-dependent oxidoreductase (luciferase family)
MSWRAWVTSTPTCNGDACRCRRSWNASGSHIARWWSRTPPERRHFRTHEFHYTKLHPGEAELIDAQLIRDTCLVGTPDELIERIRELERAGLQELTFATGNAGKWRLAEDFAREVMAKL